MSLSIRDRHVFIHHPYDDVQLTPAWEAALTGPERAAWAALTEATEGEGHATFGQLAQTSGLSLNGLKLALAGLRTKGLCDFSDDD